MLTVASLSFNDLHDLERLMKVFMKKSLSMLSLILAESSDTIKY